MPGITKMTKAELQGEVRQLRTELQAVTEDRNNVYRRADMTIEANLLVRTLLDDANRTIESLREHPFRNLWSWLKG